MPTEESRLSETRTYEYADIHEQMSDSG
jgi:hypothetical protein